MTTNPDNARLADAAQDLLDALSEEGGANYLGPRTCRSIEDMRSALRQQVRAVPGGLVWTPSEEAWGGLARDMMMWLDMGDKTPRALFKHLERTGRAIPRWLRDEPEMQALDHVPSKGTRAVLIYRAILAALFALPDDEFIHRAPTSVDPSLEGPGVVPDDVMAVIEKLRRTSGRFVSRKSGGGYEEYHVNPDGPEAATMLETLHAEIGRAVAVERDTEEMPEVAAMRYIEQLRADEGDSVTILCNDPEAETNDRLLAVECNGAWTDWEDCRFYGESVLQCLAKAIRARATLAGVGE